MKTQSANTVNQVFSFRAAAAMSVMLVGDFSHWQERPISMRKSQDGIWRTTVSLAPGTYHYRFLVDGEWREDPECTLRVPNPFGENNNVCVVAS
jgi:1,4-alpha-glucan branching enzyme